MKITTAHVTPPFATPPVWAERKRPGWETQVWPISGFHCSKVPQLAWPGWGLRYFDVQPLVGIILSTQWPLPPSSVLVVFCFHFHPTQSFRHGQVTPIRSPPVRPRRSRFASGAVPAPRGGMFDRTGTDTLTDQVKWLKRAFFITSFC